MKRPSMSDFGLVSFVGNAPDWTEQGKRQEEYVKALEQYEKFENESKPLTNSTNSGRV